VGETHVVAVRVALGVVEAERLVDVVIEVRAGTDDDVDQPVLDEIHDQRPHSSWNHSAGEAEEDRSLVAEHGIPDLRGLAEVSGLEGGVRHTLDETPRS
jgi:hypothetical protein